ncbi:PPE family protein [Mycobacterium shigaense]|uniref:PPE family protein n=1 Tax=Mycobacterium shigaense TaxID=722731 RepID=UPI000E592CA6|nr:PPE family protein [Mycobacterium shigaense]
MTGPIDFALRPPEINSALMYAGDGSGSMLAAASAWRSLAAELHHCAAAFDSTMTALVDEQWHGPVSASPAAAAAARYTTWLRTTAAWADRTAMRADAAAAAYEAAFAATVPPAVVAANRSELAYLVATNLLGQNTPAIMATQAQYMEMWAQDADAMTSYAAASMAAARLTPAAAPPEVVHPGLTDDPPTPPWQPPEWWTDLINNWGPNSNLVNSIATVVAGFTLPTTYAGLGAGGDAAAAAGDGAAAAADGAAAASADIGAIAGELARATGFGAVTSGAGNATLIGKLAVPQSWTTASEITRVSSAIGTPMVSQGQAAAPGMPGMPMANMSSRAIGRHAPQYGFRPQIITRPPSAG